MRETEKIKSFWATITASLSVFDRITTEFDQTRFTVVELQAKLGETSSECVQICLRLGDCLLLWY